MQPHGNRKAPVLSESAQEGGDPFKGGRRSRESSGTDHPVKVDVYSIPIKPKHQWSAPRNEEELRNRKLRVKSITYCE